MPKNKHTPTWTIARQSPPGQLRGQQSSRVHIAIPGKKKRKITRFHDMHAGKIQYTLTGPLPGVLHLRLPAPLPLPPPRQPPSAPPLGVPFPRGLADLSCSVGLARAATTSTSGVSTCFIYCVVVVVVVVIVVCGGVGLVHPAFIWCYIEQPCVLCPVCRTHHLSAPQPA